VSCWALQPGSCHIVQLQSMGHQTAGSLQLWNWRMRGVAQRQTGVQSAEQGVVTGGKVKEPPQTLRSHAQLRQDHTKTGVSVPDDLPQCFPRGPWPVNLSSDPDASDGWRYVEVQMHNALRAWSSDPATPRASDEARWRKGGFVLKGVTRSKASGKQGTRKEMQCQGRELGDKGVSDRHKCGFKVTLEFIRILRRGSRGTRCARDLHPPLEVGGGESCPSAQGRRNASVAATRYGEEDV
jgi:hypothetical protein